MPPKNDLSVQVDSKSASLVNDKFRSLFHVGAPLADDPPALVGAVLACFREAVRSNEASSFVPSLKGGSMPDLGLLARPRPAGPAGDVSPTPAPAGPAGDVVSNLTGASSVEERLGGGGAGPAGGMPLSAARGGPSGSEGWLGARCSQRGRANGHAPCPASGIPSRDEARVRQEAVKGRGWDSCCLRRIAHQRPP